MDIQKFIETFDPDETRSLGMNLGLDPIRLKRMKDATLNSDMIAAWINQDDQVLDKCDIPTWRAFARGLDLIKKRKFVQKIKEGIVLYNYTSLYTGSG